MNELREILDSLMGKDRNALKPTGAGFDYKANDVCKYYLLDFCPHDLFVNTKSDIGPCPNQHSDGLKAAFAADPEREYWQARYEEDYIRFMTRLVDGVSQRIAKGRERISAAYCPKDVDEDIQVSINSINSTIQSLLKDAERAGEAGDIEEAQRLTQEVNAKRVELQKLRGGPADLIAMRESQLRVCDTCGAMQSIGDAASRFESHVTGKQHVGFEQVRLKLEALRKGDAERREVLARRPKVDIRQPKPEGTGGARVEEERGGPRRYDNSRGGPRVPARDPPRYDDRRRSEGYPRYDRDSGAGGPGREGGYSGADRPAVDRDRYPARDRYPDRDGPGGDRDRYPDRRPGDYRGRDSLSGGPPRDVSQYDSARTAPRHDGAPPYHGDRGR